MGVINHDKYQGAKNFTLVAYAGANFTSRKPDLNEYVDTDGWINLIHLTWLAFLKF